MAERMYESIPSFQSYLSDAAKKEALDTWSPKMATREGQIEILDAGRNRVPSAINFLFLKTIPQTSKSFWKYFLGPNPKWQRSRIAHEDAFNVYAGMVMETLLNHGEEGGSAPLMNFDPEKMPNTDDLINKFGYYMENSMGNESRKFNSQRDRAGFTGNISKEDQKFAKVGSLDDALIKNSSGSQKHTDLPSEDTSFDVTSDVDAWGSFCEDEELDEGKSPTPREVLVAYLEIQAENGSKWTIQDVIDKLGNVSKPALMKRLETIPTILEDHGLDQQALTRLMSSLGVEELLDVLK